MNTEVPGHRQPAPGQLELVRAFVNTLDVEDMSDDVATPDELAAFLRQLDLLGEDEGVSRAEHARALAVREALRELLLANHGGYEIDPEALPTVEDAARRAKLEIRFAPDGIARPEPAKGGVDGAIGRLLAVIANAQADGTWDRLKSCPASDCRWAFYDRSRNRSAVWCNMAICGNRAKVRSYRERRAQ